MLITSAPNDEESTTRSPQRLPEADSRRLCRPRARPHPVGCNSGPVLVPSPRRRRVKSERYKPHRDESAIGANRGQHRHPVEQACNLTVESYDIFLGSALATSTKFTDHTFHGLDARKEYEISVRAHLKEAAPLQSNTLRIATKSQPQIVDITKHGAVAGGATLNTKPSRRPSTPALPAASSTFPPEPSSQEPFSSRATSRSISRKTPSCSAAPIPKTIPS